MRRIVVGLLAGCYAPAPPEGAPCGEGLRPCPTGQTCAADGRCYADPLVDPGDGSTTGTCVARRLLDGGMPVEAQGWTVERAGAGSITYDAGHVTLTTSQNARQLIVLRDAFPSDRWAIRIAGEIVQSGGCTPNEAAAAYMAGFHAPIGDAADRARMLCLTANSVAWGDGSIEVGVPLAASTITLERRGPTSIKVTIQTGSGGGSISSDGFTSNGTIAIGDQSMDAGLDSTIRIASVDLMCP